MNTINPSFLKQVAGDMEAALKPVGLKHGLSIEIGNTSYTDIQFNTKVTSKLTRDSDGNPVDVEITEFERKAALYGYDPNLYHAEFTVRNRIFKIVGYNERARKLPVLTTDDKGKRYKFPDTVFDRATRLT